MKYTCKVKVLVSQYAAEIEKFVQAYIDQGWDLQGQVLAYVVEGKVTFYATMIYEA